MDYNCLWHAISDIGPFRHRNEDAWGVLDSSLFFVLADGMGGHPSGDIAATQAVRFLCSQIRECTTSLPQAPQDFFDLLNQTNEHLFSMSLEDDTLLGMGTTLCFAKIIENKLIYGHVGDSRVYRFSKGNLQQLTKDHSLLSELIDLGKISQEESHDFDQKNILTQAVGTKEAIVPSIDLCDLLVGDKLLLCSDGLHDALTTDAIEKVLKSKLNEKQMAINLINAAKRAKTKDNITAIVIHVKKQHLSGQ